MRKHDKNRKQVRQMAVFSELIKNFDKIRDYIRDLYIYGFKTRDDFKQKSGRSYDNEKRRIESYMHDYIIQKNTKKGKNIIINVDASKIASNPLYAAWKSKSFTSNDIMLHFYLLDILSDNIPRSVPELTEIISEKSGRIFENQTIRLKCVEYEKEGLLFSEKDGKKLYYRISEMFFSDFNYKYISDAICFFSEAGFFGEIGSYIMDNSDLKNEIFSFKHHYIVHTLDDAVLYKIINAMRMKKSVLLKIHKSKSVNKAVPLKILISAATGRRYLCFYSEKSNRFTTYRLDAIKTVEFAEVFENYDLLKTKLRNNLQKVWGVSFGGASRIEFLRMRLFIDEEREKYILERILKERRSGEIKKIEDNIFEYSIICFDTSEMTPWIKTFIGRIIELECSEKSVEKRFQDDFKIMYEMYKEV